MSDVAVFHARSGSVVVEVLARPYRGNAIWAYRLLREYEYGGSTHVASTFVHGEHEADIAAALSSAMHWMANHSPADFAAAA